MDTKMFCYQCQETSKGVGCTINGVCGKNSSTSAAMDMLLFIVRGISVIADTLHSNNIDVSNKVNQYVIDSLFSTITNANFDEESILKRVERGFEVRECLKDLVLRHGITLPSVEEVEWNGNSAERLEKAKTVGVMRESDEDIRSLKELIVYGIKGIAAYLDHAMRLGYDDKKIHTFIQHTFAVITCAPNNIDELISLVMQTGENGVAAMALLDKANTESYGNPEWTKVNIGVGKNPGILISGHDLHDIEQLLQQTEGTGIDVYTHGEMLPAHYYPAFKKYEHFIGNYGNSWWKQREEFTSFNGPIVFTTNCIVPPLNSSSYKERMFTANSTGYPGCKTIKESADGIKDFSEVIAMASQCKAPDEIETGFIEGGFAHNQVLSLADKIVEAVNSGAIRKFVVMAGCDGRMKNREYYTEFAKALPDDCVILTAGCAKYRYNKLNLGSIGAIPRVLDAGQCNDSYSLALIALKLKDVFNLNDVNELPIVYNIAWYEQKAVIVLLALLYLGVKNIHLGPTLPAFLSPNVANVLVSKFGIAGISSVEDDIASLI